ncbi:MAG: DUF3592 domain-containing protein [Clostridium sp.]|nr:DUF3592 domain-containing protein [Clostridium sp.]
MDITIIVGIASIFVIFFAFLTPIIILIGTTRSRHFKKMKNQTEAQGRVTEREYVEAPSFTDGSYGGADHYQVTYDFEDRYGNHFVKRFDTVRCPFKEGDNILVYYDAANPNDCITDYEVKMSKAFPRNAFFAMLIFVMIYIAAFLFFMWAKG